jgi:hypothetical protein
MRVVAGRQHTFAIWWNLRADSTANLVTSRSPDRGATWSPPILIDTADVARAGCERKAPSATTIDDDLYVAYSMRAREGTGVFFAHFMAGMFHSPVPVIYGDRVVETAIAAQGERVVVAFEDPNGRAQRVNVAISRTQGHIFEDHTTASRDVDAAILPDVAVAGDKLAVAWRQGTRPENHFVRIGTVTR